MVSEINYICISMILTIVDKINAICIKWQCELWINKHITLPRAEHISYRDIIE